MNPLKQFRKRRRQAVTSEATRLTGKLQMPAALQPPAEALADKGSGDDGIIRPQTGNLHVSAEVFDAGENISDASTNKIIMAIVGLALAFIAFITWMIAYE